MTRIVPAALDAPSATARTGAVTLETLIGELDTRAWSPSELERLPGPWGTGSALLPCDGGMAYLLLSRPDDRVTLERLGGGERVRLDYGPGVGVPHARCQEDGALLVAWHDGARTRVDHWDGRSAVVTRRLHLHRNTVGSSIVLGPAGWAALARPARRDRVEGWLTLRNTDGTLDNELRVPHDTSVVWGTQEGYLVQRESEEGVTDWRVEGDGLTKEDERGTLGLPIAAREGETLTAEYTDRTRLVWRGEGPQVVFDPGETQTGVAGLVLGEAGAAYAAGSFNRGVPFGPRDATANTRSDGWMARLVPQGTPDVRAIRGPGYQRVQGLALVDGVAVGFVNLVGSELVRVGSVEVELSTAVQEVNFLWAPFPGE